MKRPPVPHPLDVALRTAFARQAGLDPDELSAYLEWRRPTPRDVRDRLVAAFFPAVPPDAFLAEEPLPSPQDGATITTPMQLESPQKKPPGALPTKHPFAEALRKRGLSLAEWAKANGVSASYARSWIQRGSGGRPIPKKFVAAIERQFDVPPAAWKNGTTK